MTRSNGSLPDARERLLGIVDGFDLAVGRRQQFLHEAAGRQVVVDDENARGRDDAHEAGPLNDPPGRRVARL